MKYVYSFREKSSFTQFTWQEGNTYTALDYAELIGYKAPKWWQFWRGADEKLTYKIVNKDYVL